MEAKPSHSPRIPAGSRLALERSVFHSELGLLANITSLAGDFLDSRGDQNLKVSIRRLSKTVVFGEKTLGLHPVRDSLDVILGDVGGLRVVSSHVAIVWVAQVHHGRVVGAEDATLCSLIKLVGFGRSGSQGSNSLLGAAGNKLGVTKALVVSIVAEEHGGILEEAGGLFLLNASLLGQGVPVAICRLVQRQDQIKDGLRLWGDLSKDNSGAGKSSSMMIC
ncbi:hypothetical protein HG531_001655 [Fusarium graminearum]|nr:hypothetical protein HG531_001655 [Fusarium graminearum]